jgi:hypothetical protein
MKRMRLKTLFSDPKVHLTNLQGKIIKTFIIIVLCLPVFSFAHNSAIRFSDNNSDVKESVLATNHKSGKYNPAVKGKPRVSYTMAGGLAHARAGLSAVVSGSDTICP